ncbi:MAG: polysaccharide deacetylase family protein [Candidatus Melainabacteria bacterium]|nr:polysaccharide deacetylase family protein [Candidatus Melainabacteria bacterium]
MKNHLSTKVPIIMYHRVLRKKDISLCSSYIEAGTVLSLEDFVIQIKLLKKYYSIISLNQFVDYINRQVLLPNNSCILSFDDGYIDHYKNVFPVLKKMEMPATFFIIGDCIAGTKKVRWLDKYYYILDNTPLKKSGAKLNERLSHFYRIITDKNQPFEINLLKKFIRNSPKKGKIINELATTLEVKLNPDILNKKFYLSRGHIKEMMANRMEFGAHSMSHPDLGLLSFSEAKKEILDSGKIIREMTNKNVTPFAYPFGGNSTYNKRIVEFLKSNQFSCACTSIPGLNDQRTPLFELKRIDAINLQKTLF